MKILLPEIISAITATSENADYPAANLLDMHPKKCWKTDGSVSSASVSFSLSSTDAAVSIIDFFSTAGEIQITVRIKDAADALISAFAKTYTGNRPGNKMACMVDWTPYAAQASCEIYISASGIHQIGIVQKGTILEVNDPNYGLERGFQDYSIIQELNNGAEYTKKRDKVLTFSGSLMESGMDTATGQSALIAQIQEIAPDPASIMLLHENYELTVFGKLTASASYDAYNRAMINFSFKEVL